MLLKRRTDRAQRRRKALPLARKPLRQFLHGLRQHGMAGIILPALR
jgi:hypothetical protein